MITNTQELCHVQPQCANEVGRELCDPATDYGQTPSGPNSWHRAAPLQSGRTVLGTARPTLISRTSRCSAAMPLSPSRACPLQKICVCKRVPTARAPSPRRLAPTHNAAHQHGMRLVVAVGRASGRHTGVLTEAVRIVCSYHPLRSGRREELAQVEQLRAKKFFSAMPMWRKAPVSEVRIE